MIKSNKHENSIKCPSLPLVRTYCKILRRDQDAYISLDGNLNFNFLWTASKHNFTLFVHSKLKMVKTCHRETQ